MSSQSHTLDTCGCCEGVKALTPALVENRPGLFALAYRVGTHGSFKATMQTALSGQKALRELKTRDDDDPTMALLDAWATVLDVLTFYQERIASEGYLRTATERRSVLELARAIGYELNPGVAASADLAFELETATGAPDVVTIDIGAKVQSQPGPGEQPQTFETIEKIEAHAKWNAIKPLLSETQTLSANMTTLWLKSTDANLKPGDRLLIAAPEPGGGFERALRRIASVKIEDAAKRTQLTLEPSSLAPTPTTSSETGVWVLRVKAAPFGHNAPLQPTIDPTTGIVTGSEWNLNEQGLNRLTLDAVHDQIQTDSWVVIDRPDATQPTGRRHIFAKVTQVQTLSRATYGITGRVTQLMLDVDWLKTSDTSLLVVRDMVVYAQSEQLALADIPIVDLVQDDSITLDRAYLGLKIGQKVIFTGERNDLKGVITSETMMLKEVLIEAGHTVLTFEPSLAHSYVRNTVTINANIAQATHGETKREVLGSGDASQAFQKFVLKQTPLTFVSAATPSGAASTLDVRVNDILWEEAPSLYGLAARQQDYITRMADDGKVTVQFGDGINGVRLPSGAENVVAKYRVGIGLEGMVKTGQLSLLMTRPLGVKGVTNPLPATGAANPEQLSDARQNAPLTVLTLDRVVSLQDYEDFARAFAGIGKAQATVLWNGERRLVHITVAAADGGAVDEASNLYQNLRLAIEGVGDSLQAFRIDSYTPLSFNVEAKVLVDLRYITEEVLAAVATALQEAFSFEQRAFGQSVTKSEVLAAIQSVEGVEAVDLDKLYVTGEVRALNPILLTRTAHWDASVTPPEIKPAELLILNPDGITLIEMQP